MMKWRYFKLDWKYAIGELIIITVGVLFALALDQWRSERADHVLELEYVSRLKTDLNGDIARFTQFIEVEFYNKRVVLEALVKLKNNPQSIDDTIFTRQNLDYSQYVALPETQSATIREMESSGKLNLLQNQDVLLAIDDYYERYKLLSGILANPVGEYRKIFVSTIPGRSYLHARINNEDFSNTELQTALRELINHPDIKAAINSELHYTANQIYWLSKIRKRCENLLALLEKVYPEN